MISFILIPLGAIIFLRLNRSYQFLIFSLSVMLPFSFGDLKSIPNLLIIEWLPSILFISLINTLIPIYTIEKKFRKIRFKGIEIFIFAIIVLIAWTFVSYYNNEISSTVRVTGGKTGILRTYFAIFNNILLFFTTIIFFSSYYEQIDIEKFFKIILYTSLVIGVIRIFTYFFNIETPFLAGTFKYNPEAETQIGNQGVAYRFGGLADAVVIGVPALFSYYTIRGKFNFFAFILLCSFMFISGGRTLMIGTVFTIIIFSFLFFPKNFIYLIVTGGLIFIILALFAPQSLLEGQFNRLLNLSGGGFGGQDEWRGLAWKLYLDNFLAHPIFGKGVNIYSGFIYSTHSGAEEFARQQLFAGGHGAYISILSTYGLGGITYFLILVFGGVYLSFRKIKQYLNFDSYKTAIAVFIFMILLIKSIEFITGGNGLSEATILFFVVGLIASLTVLQNMKNK